MSKQSFVRQSAWLTSAVLIGGVGMYAVHFSAKTMPKGEYGVFTTLVQLVNLMAIPALGLQTTFAQQAALASSAEGCRRLRGTVQGVLRGLFFLWLVMGLAVFVLRAPILVSLKVQNPMGLWTTIVIALASMWLTVFVGVLQGRQDFGWYGWLVIMNGLGRFGCVTFVVLVLGGEAAGGMGGVLFGALAALLIGAWCTRDAWIGPLESMAWGPWLQEVVPLTAGWGVGMYMLSADMIFVQAFFPKDETGFYAAAGMIGRALVFACLPLAVVLFPKVVAAKSRQESKRVLFQALAVTGALAVAGAAFCTVLPSLPLQIIYNASFLKISYLVPWFVWSMAPLPLVNVLVNFLLARRCWRALPVLLAIVGLYSMTLWLYLRAANSPSFLLVVQILCGFNLLLLAVCGIFVWLTYRSEANVEPPAQT